MKVPLFIPDYYSHYKSIKPFYGAQKQNPLTLRVNAADEVAWLLLPVILESC